MYEHEPELEGDLDWALFPAPETRIVGVEWIVAKATLILLVGACWYASPVLGVIGTCLAFAIKDVRNGRRLAKLIPDKAGARICSLFSYGWAAWKVGISAFGAFILCICLEQSHGRESQAGSPEELAAMAAFASTFGGFLASAGLTAAGIVIALRSGMRVWIGRGMNQARTLLLAMLLVAFTCFVLIPWTILLGVFSTNTAVASRAAPVGFASNPIFGVLLGVGFVGFVFTAPIAILLVLDRLCRRVVADRPGKFGEKVPSVGKWNT